MHPVSVYLAEFIQIDRNKETRPFLLHLEQGTTFQLAIAEAFLTYCVNTICQECFRMCFIKSQTPLRKQTAESKSKKINGHIALHQTNFLFDFLNLLSHEWNFLFLKMRAINFVS